MRRPSMPPDLRERYGPVVPSWELHTRPVPLNGPRIGGPDTPEARAGRRWLLVTALDGLVGRNRT